MTLIPILIAGGVMAGLGLILSSLLAFANKKLHVVEDPRIDQVEDMLPGANCGACGAAGCRAFAEAVVEGKMAPAGCPVNEPEMRHAIAKLLGVEAGISHKLVARLACAGGNNVAPQRAYYSGISTCRAATLLGGGGKGCGWGCLGHGDCDVACTFDAIIMDANGLPIVDEDKCTACGACVTACPRDLFSLHPFDHKLWVACQNHAKAKDARAECAVACIGCGLCVKDSEDELISLVDSLAVIDYEKNETASMDAIQRCPTGAIFWREEGNNITKGEKAKAIESEEPLPVG